MIITSKFIFVHIPKTGGTFITRVCKRLYAPTRVIEKIEKILRPNKWQFEYITSKEKYEFLGDYEYDQHCGLRHVDNKGKHVFIVKRTPESYYQSLYQFGWYKKVPHLSNEFLNTKFKSFPNLQPNEVFEYYQCLTNKMLNKEVPFGYLTQELVDQLSPTLEVRDNVYGLIIEGKIDNAIVTLKESLKGLEILDLKNLDSELKDFLVRNTSFTTTQINTAIALKPINVSKKENSERVVLSEEQKEKEAFAYKFLGYN